MDELKRKIEQTHAEWCRARGVSHEAEREAWAAHQEAVKAFEEAGGVLVDQAPSERPSEAKHKPSRNKH